MDYRIGQVVYVKTPASYGIIGDVLKSPVPTSYHGVDIKDKSLWFQPGDITVHLVGVPNIAPPDFEKIFTLQTTYRLADQFFAKGIRVVSDLKGEIEMLQAMLDEGARRNEDGVDLPSAIGFLDGIRTGKK